MNYAKRTLILTVCYHGILKSRCGWLDAYNTMLEDKQLKRAEREANRPTFAMIDSNDNSVITEDEFTVFQKKHASEMQRK